MHKPTVQEIVDAYKKTGLKPKQGTFYRDDCACAMGAYAVAKGVTDNCSDASEKRRAIVNWIYYDMPPNFVDGTIYGFDGDQYFDEEGTAEFREGYAVGQAVRKAMFEEAV